MYFNNNKFNTHPEKPMLVSYQAFTLSNIIIKYINTLRSGLKAQYFLSLQKWTQNIDLMRITIPLIDDPVLVSQ